MRKKILNFIRNTKANVDSVDISIGVEGSVADIITALCELESTGEVVRQHTVGTGYKYLIKASL